MTIQGWIARVFFGASRAAAKKGVHRRRPMRFEALEDRLAPATQLISGGVLHFSDDSSYAPSISADGRYIAFESGASNLVAGDANGSSDVFVKDTQTGTTTRVSTNSAGGESSALLDSAHASISANGRYVAFYSEASNLVAGDTNGLPDIFVKDTTTGTTTRVNTNSQGTQANKSSDLPTVSADGRYVAFASAASNLVADDTNLRQDIFLKDTATGTMTRVSTSSAGAQVNSDSDSPSISADGRYVAFSSSATNLVAGDTNGFPDIFVKDMTTGTTMRVSVPSAGGQANNGSILPAISADGRYVAYVSIASNLVPNDTNGTYDVFVTDRQTMTTMRVSTGAAGVQGNGGSGQQPGHPSISADGRYVAFWSTATNLAANDTNGRPDIFVKDTQTGTTALVSANSAGTPGDNDSFESSISADGRYVAFTSVADNLMAGDTNGFQDVFRASLGDATTTTLVATPLATTGGSSVMFKATVAPSPGAAGTVTFLDNGVPIPGGASVPLTGGVAVLTTTALSVGSHPVTAAYNGVIGFSPSVSNTQSVVINGGVAAPPQVVAVTLNGNLQSLAGNQHSRVARLVVVFDQAVQLDANAMALALHTNNVTFGGVAQPNGVGALPAALIFATTDNITWTVTFAGNTETGADGLNVLKDGVYDLTINAAKVHPRGATGVNMAANSTTAFHCLFGDIDAASSGTSGGDFQAIVNSGDNLGFRGAFNSASNYKAYFDFNGDGIINSGDNLQFRSRFNKLLTWKV